MGAFIRSTSSNRHVGPLSGLELIEFPSNPQQNSPLEKTNLEFNGTRFCVKGPVDDEQAKKIAHLVPRIHTLLHSGFWRRFAESFSYSETAPALVETLEKAVPLIEDFLAAYKVQTKTYGVIDPHVPDFGAWVVEPLKTMSLPIVRSTWGDRHIPKGIPFHGVEFVELHEKCKHPNSAVRVTGTIVSYNEEQFYMKRKVTLEQAKAIAKFIATAQVLQGASRD